MSWLQRLADELTACGVTGAERRRIVFELQDHIACEPGCEERLGDPCELARTFADQLASSRARRAAFAVFGALVLVAFALAASQLAISRTGGYPGFNRGHTLALFVPAALVMFIAPQAALVSGLLAAGRALRRRRVAVMPAGEIALIRRRASVALGAGLVTALALELYAIDFSAVLPGWWLALVGGAAAVAAIALALAAVTLVRSRSILTDAPGAAGDVLDDLPLIGWSWLRRRPRRLGVLACVGVTLAVTVFEWHAERSLMEGLERGLCEGLAAAVGFALFGRAIGVLAGQREQSQLEQAVQD